MAPDLKAEVWAELKAGKGVCEAYLSDASGKTYVHGVCLPDGTVYVNPVPSTVDSAVHELIHRLRPRYGEKRVRAETRRLMRSLTDAEMQRWFRQYTKAAKPAERMKLRPED